jgi:hypothetical protein
MECSRSGQVTLTVDTLHDLAEFSVFNMFTDTTNTDVALFALCYVTLPSDILTWQPCRICVTAPMNWLLHTLQSSGHYICRPAVTICAAQWSLYVPHSGHYMYRTVVTICTASLTFSNSTFCPHTLFVCFVWISEQTAIISLYNINWLVFIRHIVYCAVRTGL